MMITSTWVALGVLLVAFVVCKAILKLSVEISMLASAVASLIAGAFFSAPKIERLVYHVVNGTMTYLDVILVFVTATILMETIRASGGADWVVNSITQKFGHKPYLTMFLLMLAMMIPGALSGVGTTALVMLGAPVFLVLSNFNIPKRRIAGMLFVFASLGAVAPPVNLWAMIATAGATIPYVGFEIPLLLPAILLAVLTLLILGRGAKAPESQKLNGTTEKPQVNTVWWRVITPFVILIITMVTYRLLPFTFPVLGLPMQFMIATAFAWALAKKKPNFWKVSCDAVERVLPMIATTIAVGVLQEAFSATGIRGLLSYAILAMPFAVLLISLPVSMPLAGGLLAFGVAAVFGVPLMWYFQFRAMDLTIALSGLTLLWALGTALPPTAVIGRFTVLVTNYDEPYKTFLTGMWVPWLLITLVGVLMVVFSTQLSFLVI